eukprot:1864228-Pyramimonas_sp.AAC.1
MSGHFDLQYSANFHTAGAADASLPSGSWANLHLSKPRAAQVAREGSEEGSSRGLGSAERRDDTVMCGASKLEEVFEECVIEESSSISAGSSQATIAPTEVDFGLNPNLWTERAEEVALSTQVVESASPRAPTEPVRPAAEANANQPERTFEREVFSERPAYKYGEHNIRKEEFSLRFIELSPDPPIQHCKKMFVCFGGFEGFGFRECQGKKSSHSLSVIVFLDRGLAALRFHGRNEFTSAAIV